MFDQFAGRLRVLKKIHKERTTYEYVSHVRGTTPIQVLIAVYRSEAVFFPAAIWPRDVENYVGVKLIQIHTVVPVIFFRHNTKTESKRKLFIFRIRVHDKMIPVRTRTYFFSFPPPPLPPDNVQAALIAYSIQSTYILTSCCCCRSCKL